MPQIKANGLAFEYEEFGPPDGPAVIMIMGIGSQLIRWPVTFAEGMAAKGYRFIRFDNRDVGLSQKLPELGIPAVMELFQRRLAGEAVEAPYDLSDMAVDTVGLLSALGIEKAHVMGESMGGMIAQVTALNHPERVSSLISVMSTTGRPGLPQATPEASQVLFTRAEDPNDQDEVLRLAVRSRMVLAGPGFNPGEDYQREQAKMSLARSQYPEGFARQFAAILASGSREHLLPHLKLPALVIHGRDDPLVPLPCGEDTAACIPEAELKVIDGMGHAVEPDLVPILLDAIDGFIKRRVS